MNKASPNKTPSDAGAEYLPALKYHWLTSLYDTLLRVTLREATFKRQLVEQAQILPGQKVLDLGCGTATLTLLIKKMQPEAEVVGLDGDPRILRIAQSKVQNSGLDIKLDHGMSFALPYPDNSFDRVLSSLFFHHLSSENKIRTLNEIFRILRPNRELHVVDWGKPRNRLMRLAFFLVQLLDGFHTTTENVKGLLPELIRNAGFGYTMETDQLNTIFGTLSLILAKKYDGAGYT